MKHETSQIEINKKDKNIPIKNVECNYCVIPGGKNWSSEAELWS